MLSDLIGLSIRKRQKVRGAAKSRIAGVLAAVVALLVGSVPSDAGSLSVHEAPASTGDVTIGVTIYQPSSPPPEGGWPVLYLLHGLGGNETSWPKLGDIQATLDRMIADEEIAPLLVVMPGAGNSWYLDPADDEEQVTAVQKPDDYQTAILHDLPDWVEANFPVRTDRGGRAIAGLSMGGFGALRLSLIAPDRYVAAVALSGALWQNVPEDQLDLSPDELTFLSETTFFHQDDPATVEAERDLPPPGKHFAGAFGTPFDARFFNSQNVFTLLSRRIEEGAELPAFYLTVGDDDSHGLWRGAIAFYETMKAQGLDSQLRMTDGDHVWSLWRISIVDALKFVDASYSR